MKERTNHRMGRLAIWAGVCLALLLTISGPLPVAEAQAGSSQVTIYASSTGCTGDGVYLYEHNNYKGRCRRFTASDPSLADDVLNNAVSSIRFVGTYGGGRYTAILYADKSYHGAWTAFGADDPDLANDAIGSDQATSIRINPVAQCTGDGVYLYENKNYTGRCVKFTASDTSLVDNAFNDMISSIKFAGSYSGGRYKVKLCDDENYLGACSVFTVDDKGLGDENIGHDRTSSVEVVPVKPKFCIPTSGSITKRYASISALNIAGGKQPGLAPVYAAHAGTVVYVGPADTGCSRDYAVAVRYDGTIEGKFVLTLYSQMGHWSGGKFSSYIKVQLGDRVSKGQLLGYQGDAPAGICTTSPTSPQLHVAVYEKAKPFLDEYRTWGKRCEHSDLFFETGGTTASCALKHTAEAVNPEAPRLMGALGASVNQTCHK